MDDPKVVEFELRELKCRLEEARYDVVRANANLQRAEGIYDQKIRELIALRKIDAELDILSI